MLILTKLYNSVDSILSVIMINLQLNVNILPSILCLHSFLLLLWLQGYRCLISPLALITTGPLWDLFHQLSPHHPNCIYTHKHKQTQISPSFEETNPSNYGSLWLLMSLLSQPNLKKVVSTCHLYFFPLLNLLKCA